jgi:hypothetical protein
VPCALSADTRQHLRKTNAATTYLSHCHIDGGMAHYQSPPTRRCQLPAIGIASSSRANNVRPNPLWSRRRQPFNCSSWGFVVLDPSWGIAVALVMASSEDSGPGSSPALRRQRHACDPTALISSLSFLPGTDDQICCDQPQDRTPSSFVEGCRQQWCQTSPTPSRHAILSPSDSTCSPRRPVAAPSAVAQAQKASTSARYIRSASTNPEPAPAKEKTRGYRCLAILQLALDS